MASQAQEAMDRVRLTASADWSQDLAAARRSGGLWAGESERPRPVLSPHGLGERNAANNRE